MTLLLLAVILIPHLLKVSITPSIISFLFLFRNFSNSAYDNFFNSSGKLKIVLLGFPVLSILHNSADLSKSIII